MTRPVLQRHVWLPHIKWNGTVGSNCSWSDSYANYTTATKFSHCSGVNTLLFPPKDAKTIDKIRGKDLSWKHCNELNYIGFGYTSRKCPHCSGHAMVGKHVFFFKKISK